MGLTNRQKLQIGLGVAGGFVVILVIVLCVTLIPRGSKTGGGGSGDPPPVKGVCYEPGELVGTTEAMRSCVINDLQLIRDAGYRCVLTRTAFFNGNEGSYAEACAQVSGGLSVLLGIEDATEWAQLMPILTGAHAGAVYGVSLNGPASLALQAAQQLRASVGANRTRIGTSTAITATDAELVALRDGLDFVGVQLYAGTPTGGPALASADPSWNNMSIQTQGQQFKQVLGKKMVVAATGMPWAGTCKAGDGSVVTYTRPLQDSLVAEAHRLVSSLPAATFVNMAFDVESLPEFTACAATGPTGSGARALGVLQPAAGLRCPRGTEIQTTRSEGCVPCGLRRSSAGSRRVPG